MIYICIQNTKYTNNIVNNILKYSIINIINTINICIINILYIIRLAVNLLFQNFSADTANSGVIDRQEPIDRRLSRPTESRDFDMTSK